MSPTSSKKKTFTGRYGERQPLRIGSDDKKPLLKPVDTWYKLLMSPDNHDDDFPIRPATSPLSDKDKEKIMEVALERMVLIDGKVYGLEDESEPEAYVDCLSKLRLCRALCCTYVFALTQEEVRKGRIKYNLQRPYYIARDDDGYCPYLDRATYKCTVHDERPLRCRKFACKL